MDINSHSLHVIGTIWNIGKFQKTCQIPKIHQFWKPRNSEKKVKFNWFEKLLDKNMNCANLLGRPSILLKMLSSEVEYDEFSYFFEISSFWFVGILFYANLAFLCSRNTTTSNSVLYCSWIDNIPVFHPSLIILSSNLLSIPWEIGGMCVWMEIDYP